MRDPERIDRIIEKIRIEWHAYPDLRLLQFLHNHCNPAEDQYNMEDDELERRIDQGMSCDRHLS
jgi:uncharacterized protein YihD (DUF1040 family)